MTVEDFLLRMIKDLGIQVMNNDYHFEESGSCHILLDRGTNYDDYYNEGIDQEVQNLVEKEYEEFMHKYGHLEFAVRKYIKDHGFEGSCYFTHDDEKGHLYLDLNVIFNTNDVLVFHMTEDAITELINTKLRPSDGFRFKYTNLRKGSNSLTGKIDLIVHGKNHGAITQIHIERHAERELVLTGFGSMVRFSKYSEIQDKLINLGDHLAFKASEYLKHADAF